ncbi:MAG: MarR family transcriptional regulator [Coriobacteriia bacterium]|nr:MarR family transcriptional regulator [Coriobacteriia bacterium]
MRPEPTDVGYLANRFARLMRARMADNLSPTGLTPQQAAVLLSVVHAPGVSTPSAVAGRLGMDRPTMTGLVRRLERDAWLEVTPNPGDSRSHLLAPSPRATAALADIEDAAARVTCALVGVVGAQRVSELAALLAEAGDALEASPEMKGVR